MKQCIPVAITLVWELPQNVLGALALAQFVAQSAILDIRLANERVMVELQGSGAVSLGAFVFFTCQDNPYVPVGRENEAHELGHSHQSRMLGPLYLPVVGIPSLLRVLYALAHRRLTGRRWAGYYDGFPENWADSLGGADRTLRPPP